MNGLLDVKVVIEEQPIATPSEEHLLPCLLPSDGINPHSVVIMDNRSIYHVNEIIQMIEEEG